MTIDDDVFDRARTLSEKLCTPFRRVVNDALRAGMEAVEEPSKMRRYKTAPHKMGLKAGKNLDNIHEILAQAAIPQFRGNSGQFPIPGTPYLIIDTS